MSKAKIEKHQVMMDTAIQYTGGAEALFDIALLNGVSITEEVEAGTILLLPDDVLNKKALKYLTTGNYKPITLIPNDGELNGVGIEFWGIEFDFIVS